MGSEGQGAWGSERQQQQEYGEKGRCDQDRTRGERWARAVQLSQGGAADAAARLGDQSGAVGADQPGATPADRVVAAH